MELEKTGAELTPEETERLAEHRQKKAAQHKAWRDAIHITSNADGGEIFSFLLLSCLYDSAIRQDRTNFTILLTRKYSYTIMVTNVA